MQHPTIPEEIAGHNVTRLGKGEGRTTDITNLRLIWKARGVATGYQFSIFELTIPPGAGIPLHKHPYPEFFYVLEGQIDFACLGSEGTMEWLGCTAGESVMAPPNAPHAFHNHGAEPGTFLSVSNYHHQVLLDVTGAMVSSIKTIPSEMSPEVFKQIDEANSKNQTFMIDV